MTAKRLPRGVRLHNPLNLRESPGDKTQWLHERIEDTDPEFEEFDIAEGGFRAAAITFRTYKLKHGVDTVKAWIARWAPAKGKDGKGQAYTQDTAAYTQAICNALSVDDEDKVDLEHWDTVFAALKAMTRHEQGPAPKGWEGRSDGSWYSDVVIVRGMELARVKRPSVGDQVVHSPTAQTAAATVAGGIGLGVNELVTIANAGRGFADMDTASLVRIVVVILIVVGSLYIINRRAKHAKAG